jgi:hypothetical protein
LVSGRPCPPPLPLPLPLSLSQFGFFLDLMERRRRDHSLTHTTGTVSTTAFWPTTLVGSSVTRFSRQKNALNRFNLLQILRRCFAQGENDLSCTLLFELEAKFGTYFQNCLV